MSVQKLAQGMEKVALACIIVVLALVLPCNATIYTVGDSAGWDISSDLNAWPAQKKFVVGDSLLFLYSSTHSVNEVTKENYDGCNTMVATNSYSNGNNTIPLTTGSDKYFVCGNKLHCLGGMKLHIHVEGNEANTPASAPVQSRSNPSLRSNNPVPTSHGSNIPSGFLSGLVSSLCFVSIVLVMV